MKGKLLQKTTALILVLCMTMANFLFVATNAVYALSESEISIEGGKITFDAYFTNQSGNKTYTKDANLTEGATLYAKIKLESGIFKDAVIKINNANFKLPEIINNPYVAGVNNVTKEIKLRELKGSYDNNIELEIPITFEKQSEMNADYFNMENSVILSGEYKASETYKHVEGTINTKLKWYGEASVKSEEGFEKSIFEDDRVIIQEYLSSTTQNLPKVSETIKITAPKVLDKFPDKIVVLKNGQKINDSTVSSNYNLNTGALELTFNYKENNIIDWSHDTDTYKIIYTYEQQVEKENRATAITNGKSQIIVTIFGYENEPFTSKEFSSGAGYNYGNKVSVEANNISTNVYKGFMYSNSENGTGYNEKYDVEVSDINGINKIKLNLENDNFKSGETNIETNSRTLYKKILVNWEDVSKILGTEGTLTINDDKGNTTTIDNTSEKNEKSYIIADIDTHNITITTSAPISEGILPIYVQKSIAGDAGLNKETIQTINAVETTVKVTTNQDEEGMTATATTELKEPTTKPAQLTLSTETLSTTNENNVEIQVKLATGTQDTYLFKQPTITLQLPEDVTNISNVTAKALFAENNELTVSNINVDKNQITIAIDGTQTSFDNQVTGGIVVTVYANIEVNKYAASKTGTITMSYTNENAATQPEPVTEKINIESPNKILTEAKVTGEGAMNFEATIANVTNNAIENLALIAELPNGKNLEEYTDEIKQTLNTTIGNTDVTIEENKIIFNESKLDVEQSAQIKFTLNNINAIPTFKLAYTVDGKEETTEIKLDMGETNFVGEQEQAPSEQQPEKVEGKEEKTDNLTVKMTAISGNKELKDGEEIYAGQPITYTYIVKNESDKDLENVKLTVNHNETAKIYENVTEKDELQKDYTFEKLTEKTSKEFDLKTLKAKTAMQVIYQARVNDNAETLATHATVTGKDIEDIQIEQSNNVKQAELKLELTTNVSKEYSVEKDIISQNVIKITNNTDKLLENIYVTMDIPQEFKLEQLAAYSKNSDDFEITNTANNKLSFKIKQLAAKNNKQYRVALEMTEENPTKSKAEYSYSAILGENTYYSNNVTVNLRRAQKSSIQVAHVANIKEDTVKTGDELVYTIAFRNTGINTDEFIFTDNVPNAAVIQKASYKIGEKEAQITDIENNTISETIVLNPEEAVVITITTKIDEGKTGREQITNYATIVGNLLEEEVKTEEITHKLAANIREQEEPENPTPGENPEEPSNPETEKPGESGTPSIPGTVTAKNSISGMVWLDSNKNGIRESAEKPLSGITVMLINTQTNKFVTNNQGSRLEVKTNSNGTYSFESIEEGKYMVVFTYDNVKYRNTEYQVASATENTNSDIITGRISTDNNASLYGMTSTLELKDKSLEHIDAGFIENEIFNLTLNKYISKITVQNSAGTVVKQYDKEQLAKIEIDAKLLASSTILVEYTLEVTNNGELAGYANELIDYMPKDFTFSSEINKNWYKSTDGNVHTTALSKELIQPGETKTVVLTLTKAMTENNTGVTTNIAEIVKSSNELSIPDNNATDNTSSSEMIVSIRTGVEFTIGIIIAIIALTVTGIIVYTKKRKEAKHE